MLESVGTNYNELTFFKFSLDIELGNELMRDPHLWQKCYLTHGVVEAANFELAHLEYNKLTQEICEVLLERNDSGLEMLKFVANYFPLLSVLGAGQP